MRGTIQLRSKLDKNGVGTYRIEISTGKQPDGTYGRLRETFKGTKQQAELRKAELLIKLSKNEYIPDSNMTFGELAKRWIEDVRVNLAPNTHRFYKDILDPYILPEIKELPVSKLNSVAIRTLIKRRDYHCAPQMHGSKDMSFQGLPLEIKRSSNSYTIIE